MSSSLMPLLLAFMLPQAALLLIWLLSWLLRACAPDSYQVF
jgi:hypothetical protein